MSDLIGRHWKEPLIKLVIHDLLNDIERIENQIEKSPEILADHRPELVRALARLEGAISKLGGLHASNSESPLCK